MTQSSRVVLPELLDRIAPDDSRARRSRADLRRVHTVMRTIHILRAALNTLNLAATPRNILELGAGDGTLLLSLARSLNPTWRNVHVALLDQHDLVKPATREAFRQLGWSVSVLSTDVLIWAAQDSTCQYDLCLTTLFLHHFDAATLPAVLFAVAARTEAFVACEPRRDTLSWAASRLVGLIGANTVTRQDAVTSVAAGFLGRDLTTEWQQVPGQWNTREYWAAPFTHCFTAVRSSVYAARDSDG